MNQESAPPLHVIARVWREWKRHRTAASGRCAHRVVASRYWTYISLILRGWVIQPSASAGVPSIARQVLLTGDVVRAGEAVISLRIDAEKTSRIEVADRVFTHIDVGIWPSHQSNRIALDVPTRVRIVISEVVVKRTTRHTAVVAMGVLPRRGAGCG